MCPPIGARALQKGHHTSHNPLSRLEGEEKTGNLDPKINTPQKALKNPQTGLYTPNPARWLKKPLHPLVDPALRPFALLSLRLWSTKSTRHPTTFLAVQRRKKKTRDANSKINTHQKTLKNPHIGLYSPDHADWLKKPVHAPSRPEPKTLCPPIGAPLLHKNNKTSRHPPTP